MLREQAGKTLKLSIPIIFGELAQMVLHLIDAARRDSGRAYENCTKTFMTSLQPLIRCSLSKNYRAN
jgi:hypothetical protein